MLSFQKQKERKKLEREERMEDASEQVRAHTPKLPPSSYLVLLKLDQGGKHSYLLPVTYVSPESYNKTSVITIQ